MLSNEIAVSLHTGHCCRWHHLQDLPTAVPTADWDYTDTSLTAIHLLPPGTPFQRGTLYEFAYSARDPLVMGLGFAAIRDVAAFVYSLGTVFRV